jgi:diphthamide synthase (EF-2-diphthine--ammonia ligase)
VWRRDTDTLAAEVLAAGIRAVVVAVDLNVLDESFLGRPYDERLLADLPPGADPCAETGEFHTFVTHHPRFGAPIPVEVGERTRRGTLGFVDLVPA